MKKRRYNRSRLASNGQYRPEEAEAHYSYESLTEDDDSIVDFQAIGSQRIPRSLYQVKYSVEGIHAMLEEHGFEPPKAPTEDQVKRLIQLSISNPRKRKRLKAMNQAIEAQLRARDDEFDK